ncbi:unnamed protein product [Ectocarpus fasciculatus]
MRVANRTTYRTQNSFSCASTLLCAIQCLQRGKLRIIPGKNDKERTRNFFHASSSPNDHPDPHIKFPGVCFPRRFVACTNLSMISNINPVRLFSSFTTTNNNILSHVPRTIKIVI